MGGSETGGAARLHQSFMLWFGLRMIIGCVYCICLQSTDKKRVEEEELFLIEVYYIIEVCYLNHYIT